MKFICDTMLGKLARWLRILGYDTTYARGEDESIIAEAKSEKRALLTRDKELAVRADGILIRSFLVDEQLKELLDLGLIELKEENMFSRCPLCNSLLKPVDKESVRGKVPLKSFESSDSFWYCESCNKYYWIGKHWDNIKEKIEKLRR